jgi:hypothetical protein
VRNWRLDGKDLRITQRAKTRRRKDAARQAVRKEFEQEITEITEKKSFLEMTGRKNLAISDGDWKLKPTNGADGCFNFRSRADRSGNVAGGRTGDDRGAVAPTPHRDAAARNGGGQGCHQVLSLGQTQKSTCGKPYRQLAQKQTCYVCSKATQQIYTTLGIGDRFGYSVVGGHAHCQVPQNEIPEIGAFLDKFILGKMDTVTAVADSPTNYVDIDFARWYAWWGTGKPVLPVAKTTTPPAAP